MPDSLAAAARAVGAGERTLERRIRRSSGKSPIAFVQDLRVEEAVHQLETTERSIEEIAAGDGRGGSRGREAGTPCRLRAPQSGS